MSLDICLKCEHCNQSTESLNCTHNVSTMVRDACPSLGWLELDGISGEQSLPSLTEAYIKLKKDPKKYTAMNPNNGWGSYEGLLEFLKNAIYLALDNPSLIWKTSR